MSQTFEFYSERAAEAAEEAAAATLDNVRERHERAEKTWTALANQAHKVKADRIKAEETKAAQREVEAREAEARVAAAGAAMPAA